MQAIEWCHFRWPWVTPDQGFKITVVLKSEYLENCAFLQGVSVAACPVLATIGMSVCLSVCLSVTHWHWRCKLGSRNLHRRIALRLVFGIKNSSRNSKGFTPSEGVKWEWGWENIGSRIRPFDWCQNQRPWMTLNGRYALCCKNDASFGTHHKNLNEDRPILSAAEM